jgi:hypothetical protein
VTSPLNLAKSERIIKRISSGSARHLIVENRRTDMITVMTESGVHVATMSRRTAVKDGLIVSRPSSKPSRRKI